MEEQIIVLKISKYVNDKELKQLMYNIVCNLFSPCILLNSAAQILRAFEKQTYGIIRIFKDF